MRESPPGIGDIQQSAHNMSALQYTIKGISNVLIVTNDTWKTALTCLQQGRSGTIGMFEMGEIQARNHIRALIDTGKYIEAWEKGIFLLQEFQLEGIEDMIAMMEVSTSFAQQSRHNVETLMKLLDEARTLSIQGADQVRSSLQYYIREMNLSPIGTSSSSESSSSV